MIDRQLSGLCKMYNTGVFVRSHDGYKRKAASELTADADVFGNSGNSVPRLQSAQLLEQVHVRVAMWHEL